MTFPHPELQPVDDGVSTKFNPERVFSSWFWFEGREARGWCLLSISSDAGFLLQQNVRRGGLTRVMVHDSKASVDALSFKWLYQEPMGDGRLVG